MTGCCTYCDWCLLRAIIELIDAFFAGLASRRCRCNSGFLHFRQRRWPSPSVYCQYSVPAGPGIPAASLLLLALRTIVFFISQREPNRCIEGLPFIHSKPGSLRRSFSLSVSFGRGGVLQVCFDVPVVHGTGASYYLQVPGSGHRHLAVLEFHLCFIPIHRINSTSASCNTTLRES